MSQLVFHPHLDENIGKFAPRLGTVSLRRQDGSEVEDIATPGLITTTSRGVVPHLSRDHVEGTDAIRWAQIHFETFLERTPPILTLQGGPRPLHTFLGYKPEQYILSLCVRDPADGSELPANTKDFISTRCVRGVRKMTPSAWREYVLACKPDVVTALADIPFTPPPYSQKRILKSLERSTAWLADLLRPLFVDGQPHRTGLTVLVSMAGGIDVRARQAFADGLVEKLHGNDLELVRPLTTLDEGISGYVFDLVPLRIQSDVARGDKTSEALESMQQLAKVSLEPLPTSKLRTVHSPRSPHEILRFIQEVGVDLFDAPWAQSAANIGVALDFSFPVRDPSSLPSEAHCLRPARRPSGRVDLGHNLFNPAYAHDHSRLASLFLDRATASKLTEPTTNICTCAACSPQPSQQHIRHSANDAAVELQSAQPQRPYTRAYLHHLLHTHEMSSHTLLVMHNLNVVDAFFSGVRATLKKSGQSAFAEAVERFCATYDEDMIIFDEAEKDWAAVERARGKGRLKEQEG